MLFKRSILEGIAAGRVTLAFRRWRRAAVKAGGTLRTSAGVLRFEAIEPVASSAVTPGEAKRAGYASMEALQRDLGPDDGRCVYRIAFQRAGEDPRIELRRRRTLDAAARADLQRRLDRYDTAAAKPWTAHALRLIAQCPGVGAADLAREVRLDRDKFKINVRKLKNLGLTECLDVGYRLSPLGRAFLAPAAKSGDRR